jgi:NAD(P)-dependent dehydrogenase (short-subunit alcohol dehydrogenase family)
MPDAVVVRQVPAEVADIERQLLAHFRAARAALTDGRAVIVEVEGHDLLGQGAVADAAVACALLGMARALALEGLKPGWSINVVTRGSEELDLTALADEGRSGQLLYADLAHLGKVRP